MCILERETDIELFETQIKQFTECWAEGETELIKYFLENYANRASLIPTSHTNNKEE